MLAFFVQTTENKRRVTLIAICSFLEPLKPGLCIADVPIAFEESSSQSILGLSVSSPRSSNDAHSLGPAVLAIALEDIFNRIGIGRAQSDQENDRYRQQNSHKPL